jgi:hypothetical protein
MQVGSIVLQLHREFKFLEHSRGSYYYRPIIRGGEQQCCIDWHLY